MRIMPRSQSYRRFLITFFLVVLSVLTFPSRDRNSDKPGFSEDFVRDGQDFKLLSKSRSGKKVILFWTQWYRKIPWEGRFGNASTYVNAGCTPYKCEFTYKRRKLREAHAVLFKSDEIKYWRLPRRFPNQRWVWVEVESPLVQRGERALSIANVIGSDKFNWTMSYHESSDIIGANGYLLSRDMTMPLRANQLSHHKPTLERYLRAMKANTTLEDVMGEGWKDFVNRPKAVFWMSSNCQTPSRREDYVEELSKYIQVDKFGKCGDGEFTCGNPYEAFEETCWNTIFKKQYLFALAFENSLCNHYLSEKPYNPLIYGLVPIVWGGEGYEEFLPPGSFINARSFHPKDLAELIHKLQSDPTAYGRYHIWRHYWQAFVRGSFCELCHRLHTDPVRGHHADLAAWRQRAERCFNPPEDMFGSDAWKEVIRAGK